MLIYCFNVIVWIQRTDNNTVTVSPLKTGKPRYIFPPLQWPVKIHKKDPYTGTPMYLHNSLSKV